ncbi:MAG: non-canonical purine NTP pyrophosphatase [Clostridia bacterium]
MKVLFATTNPAKVNKYANQLREKNVELITIKDIGINLKPEEIGKNAIENAYIKAKAYYDRTKITTIGMDNNLYIEGLPDEKQPGTHVRRINGKELNDEEMIDYYSNLVSQYGGKLSAKWVYGMVVYNGKETKKYSWSKGNFYLVNEASKKRNPGYPLDSISIMPGCDKYFVDLTENDKKNNKENYNEDDVVKFIVDSIKI